ncbi:MAG: hypothetical protein P4L42_01000 [Desulfocapsaceae bacterium]|nr:hypothetical protein [Desulfocapsaceae bacterium]
MNENIALMKVRRMELVEQQSSLRMKAKILCRTISPLINPALVDVEKMHVAEAANTMDELVVTQAELLQVASKIADLEEALGN